MRKTITLAVIAFLLSAFAFSVVVKNILLSYDFNLVPTDYTESVVLRVVDGDTFQCLHIGKDKKVTVRMVGVDTPETVHPNKEVQTGGPEASRFLKRILNPGDTVYLTYDKSKYDRYDRTLAYVWIKTDRWIMLNLLLVRNGYGIAYIKYKFNKDYMPIFVSAQEEAKKEKLNLWRQSE